jgi:hypothetical protein
VVRRADRLELQEAARPRYLSTHPSRGTSAHASPAQVFNVSPGFSRANLQGLEIHTLDVARLPRGRNRGASLIYAGTIRPGAERIAHSAGDVGILCCDDARSHRSHHAPQRAARDNPTPPRITQTLVGFPRNNTTTYTVNCSSKFDAHYKSRQ